MVNNMLCLFLKKSVTKDSENQNSETKWQTTKKWYSLHTKLVFSILSQIKLTDTKGLTDDRH